MEPYRVVLRAGARGALTALLACFAACSLLSRETYRGDPPASNEEALERFAREVHLAHVDRQPDLRARLGLPWAERWLARRDPQRIDVERELLQRELDVLASDHPPDRLGPAGRLGRELLAESVRAELASLRWTEHDARPHPRHGPHLGLLDELAGREIRSEADVRAWIAAVSHAADAFVRLARDAESLAEAEIVAPRSAYRTVAAQCRAAMSGRPFRSTGPDAPSYAALRAGLFALTELDAERRERWLDEAEDALRERLGAAIEEYADVLGRIERARAEDRGAWALPDGDAWYDDRVRRACGRAASIDDVEERARELVASARAELEGLAGQLDHPGTLESFLDFAREDARFQVPAARGGTSPGAGLTALARRLAATAEAAMDRVVLDVPRAPLLVEPAPRAPLEPTYVPAAGPRAPARWIPDFTDRARWPRPRLKVEAHRQGWPGRHLRVSVLVDLRDLDPFRRHLVQPAWSEGWDLYALRVAEEVGLAEDPYDRVARLAEELWAGALALADFGIHRRQWEPADAREWLVRTTARPRPECEAAVQALLLDPGDATAAAWGLATIVAQRERATRALGDEFDSRAFHDAVIGAGPLPPAFVADRVTAWLEKRP